MANRHERRKLAKLEKPRFPAINISVGRCLMVGNPRLDCFACGNSAREWAWPNGPAPFGYGLAEISAGGQAKQVPICERCLTSGDVTNVIARKILDAPDLQFTDGGEATAEQISALSEKSGAIEH